LIADIRGGCGTWDFLGQGYCPEGLIIIKIRDGYDKRGDEEEGADMGDIDSVADWGIGFSFNSNLDYRLVGKRAGGNYIP
jgi:hypothetical protein